MKYLSRILLIFLLLPFAAISQKTIKDYIRLVPLSDCYTYDMPLNDTSFDGNSDYLTVDYSEDEGADTIVTARLFKNADGTATIAVSGIFKDAQCAFYKMHFYEYSEKTGMKEISD